MRYAAIGLAALLVFGCGGDAPPAPQAGPLSFAGDIAPILVTSCATIRCHDRTTARMGLDLFPVGGTREIHANIVDVPSVQLSSLDLIGPSQPGASYLIHKIQGTQETVGGSGVRMPKFDAPLSPKEIDEIRTWVSEGARNN